MLNVDVTGEETGRAKLTLISSCIPPTFSVCELFHVSIANDPVHCYRTAEPSTNGECRCSLASAGRAEPHSIASPIY